MAPGSVSAEEGNLPRRMIQTSVIVEIFWLVLLLWLTRKLYLRVTMSQLDFATGLLLLAVLTSSCFLVGEIMMRTFGAVRQTKINVRLLLAVVGLLLMTVEVFFRFGLGAYKTYGELSEDGVFFSLYPVPGPTWFHRYPPNTPLEWQLAGFVHRRSINSLGLAEREIDPRVADGEYRILALGDSFTEGVGTTYDSTWVKVMERAMTAQIPHTKVTTINAGIAASDVWFEYALLKEQLLAFLPNLVIVAINNYRRS